MTKHIKHLNSQKSTVPHPANYIIIKGVKFTREFCPEKPYSDCKYRKSLIWQRSLRLPGTQLRLLLNPITRKNQSSSKDIKIPVPKSSKQTIQKNQQDSFDLIENIFIKQSEKLITTN